LIKQYPATMGLTLAFYPQQRTKNFSKHAREEAFTGCGDPMAIFEGVRIRETGYLGGWKFWDSSRLVA
jgi:hypothetical protein